MAYIDCFACEGNPRPTNEPCCLCGGSGKIGEFKLPEDPIAQARAEGYAAGLEAAAQVNLSRIGREWVSDSLWANIARDMGAAIRALSPQSGKEG